MFFHHDVSGPVELWFTDRSLDLADVADTIHVDSLAGMEQLHGADVAWVKDDTVRPAVDALLTDAVGLALLVRVADCVPVVLAAPDDGLVGVVHCGRLGLVTGVVPAAIEALRERGARRLAAWIGPRACGRCYELPTQMADDVAAAVLEARSTTSWGTSAADIGAGVVAQLAAGKVQVHDLGAEVCTIEDERFFSYRREGDRAGRFGAVVVLREEP
ncbi:MAG: polyphenol oxidase family protein [Aeromicrobium sp.]